MTKIFLKDMLDRRSFIKYIFISILIYAGFDYLISKNPTLANINFDLRLMVLLSVALFTTIYYFSKTYTQRVDTIFYYQLPIKRKELNRSFILSLVIDTLVKKIGPIFAIGIILGADKIFFILTIFFTPIICVLGSLPAAVNINNSKKLLDFALGLVLIGIFLYLSFKTKLGFSVLLVTLLAGLAFYWLILSNTYFDIAIFSSEGVGRGKRFALGNYFLKYFLAENVYLINTFGILAMIVFILLIFPGDIKFPLAFAVATVNTPLLTIYSTDEGLQSYKKMLPDKYESLDKDYKKILLLYFAIVHLLILALNIADFSLKLLGLAIFLTIFNSYCSFYLEDKFTIANKKTTMEIWKSPRKYILGVVVFFISFLVLLII